MDVISDCRTDEGVTIGLLDSIIFIARVLATRDLQSENVQAVLRDLRNDEDVQKLWDAVEQK